jgi:hypothetical protein
MRNLYLFIALILVAFSFPISAQVKVSGKITDAKTKKPVAYADISFPISGNYTSSNTDGSFYLESLENDTILEISSEKYDFKEFSLSGRVNFNLNITLNPSVNADNTIELDNAVITSRTTKFKNKKENPAYPIMREIWARKKFNGLKSVPQYEYEEYEKLQFDLNNIDSVITKSRLFKDMEFIFENIDTSEITGKAFLPAFLNESIYKVYGKNEPNRKERRDLIANKSSGFDDNEIVGQTLKNLYKDFNIYENRLNFFNKNFVSPIARDGFAVYEYELTDTLSIEGKDYYRIKYYPKRDGEYTFKGDFYVSMKEYAIKEIAMQSTKNIDVNFVRDIFVAQNFEIVNDSVFYPTREYILLDMALLTKKDNAKGMFAHRTVSYKDFNFDTPHPDQFYSPRNYEPYAAGAFEKEDSFWAEARHERLSKNEGGIYAMLDSLQQVPRFNRIVKSVEILGSGYWNVGNAIDIGDLYSTIGYNDIEGLRVRAGARTYFSQNDMWRLAGYMAYGFGDHQFKYGVEARFMFDKFNRFQIGGGTKRDVEQLGVQLTTSDGIMTRSFASSSIIGMGDNNKLSHINKTNIYTSIDPWRNFTIRLDGNYQTTRAADPALFNISYLNEKGWEEAHLIDTNLSLSIIARPGAKFSQYGLDRYEHSTLAPTIMLRYTRGFSGLFNSQFDYNKIQFLFAKPFLIGSFGKSDVVLEAGKTFEGLPLSLLSVIPGNESYGHVPGTFSQVDYYEFITDSYATFILDHHFNGWILNKIPLIKKLKLREVGFIRAAWGDISEKSREINRSGVPYLAPKNQIYFEYGFGLENIGIGNFRPFRINFNWRGNYLENPDARKFGITIGMGTTF